MAKKRKKAIALQQQLEANNPSPKSIWRLLKEGNFPQGGVGNWLQDPNSDEKYYIPHPSEIYQATIQDPQGWEELSESMGVVWLKQHGKSLN